MFRRASLVGLLLLVMATMLSASPMKGASNTFAVCACGKVFVPDDKTEYITYNGQQYACCTHACHEMAAKDPAAAAKLAADMTAQKLHELNDVKFNVANVIAVTEQGTRALCGCGKEFMIDPTTEYIQYAGNSYACCSHACHEMAAKDPASAVKSFADKMKSTK